MSDASPKWEVVACINGNCVYRKGGLEAHEAQAFCSFAGKGGAPFEYRWPDGERFVLIGAPFAAWARVEKG